MSFFHSGSEPWCLGSGWPTWAIGRSPPPWCCWLCMEATCVRWGATATWSGKGSSSWLQKTRILKSSKTDGRWMSVFVRWHGRLFLFLVAAVLQPTIDYWRFLSFWDDECVMIFTLNEKIIVYCCILNASEHTMCPVVHLEIRRIPQGAFFWWQPVFGKTFRQETPVRTWSHTFSFSLHTWLLNS